MLTLTNVELPLYPGELNLNWTNDVDTPAALLIDRLVKTAWPLAFVFTVTVPFKVLPSLLVMNAVIGTFASGSGPPAAPKS